MQRGNDRAYEPADVVLGARLARLCPAPQAGETRDAVGVGGGDQIALPVGGQVGVHRTRDHRELPSEWLLSRLAAYGSQAIRAQHGLTTYSPLSAHGLSYEPGKMST